MDKRERLAAERPRTEPEILPPGQDEPRQPARGARIFVSARGVHIALARPGPLAMIVAVLLGGVAALAALILLFGAILLWLPLFGVLAGAVILTGLWRGGFQRPR